MTPGAMYTPGVVMVFRSGTPQASLLARSTSVLHRRTSTSLGMVEWLFVLRQISTMPLWLPRGVTSTVRCENLPSQDNEEIADSVQMVNI